MTSISRGTTDIAVISLGLFTAVRFLAGNEMDEAITQYKAEIQLADRERTAEQIKIEIGSAYPLDEPISMEIKGAT
jgi:rod shape-determining protein MreB